MPPPSPPWRRNGRITAASPSLRRCASQPPAAPDASGCCVTVHGLRSPSSGRANSIPSTCSTTKPGQEDTGPLRLTPLQFLAPLAALVAPPKVQRHRYLELLARTARRCASYAEEADARGLR
jgi:hypothetical protein